MLTLDVVRPLVRRLVVLPLVLTLTACAAAGASGAAVLADARPTPTAAPTANPTPSPTPSPSPTPTVYWPLRGTIASDPAAVHRRPIAVRMPNDLTGRPQSGLNDADMVWEMLVEGGITRYMTVFHSRDAAQVGPVRSARLSDLHLLPMLRGILAHVGASHPVMERIAAASRAGAFVDVDEFFYGGFYSRVAFRAPPQNVYTSTARLRAAAAAAGDGAAVDVPSFDFAHGEGAADADAASTAAASVAIPYGGAMAETYTYDAAAGGYRRAQDGVRTVDGASGQPVLATNVVVIHTDVTTVPSIVEDALGSLSLEIRSTGSGPVTIFTGGRRFDGTWSRRGDGAYHFAEGGVPLLLQPGQTWVHVVPASWEITSAP